MIRRLLVLNSFGFVLLMMFFLTKSPSTHGSAGKKKAKQTRVMFFVDHSNVAEQHDRHATRELSTGPAKKSTAGKR